MSERDLSNGTNTPISESASHQENTAVKDNHTKQLEFILKICGRDLTP
jgi:hypothetical protein